MSKPLPNYTQVPNWFLDNFQDLSLSEIKVMLSICRYTFGYHKDRAKLSLSTLERLTGLTQKSIIAGASDLIKRGWVVKTPKGRSFEYELDLDLALSTLEQVKEQNLPVPVVGIETTLEQVKGPTLEQVKDIKEREEIKPETNSPAGAAITSEPEKPSKSSKPKSDPRHKQFISEWCMAYHDSFADADYQFAGRDAKRLSEFLKLNPETQVPALIDVARAAWTKRNAGSKFFKCGQSCSIAGFTDWFNDIRNELKTAGILQTDEPSRWDDIGKREATT